MITIYQVYLFLNLFLIENKDQTEDLHDELRLSIYHMLEYTCSLDAAHFMNYNMISLKEVRIYLTDMFILIDNK